MNVAAITAALASNGKGHIYPDHANVVFILQHDPLFTVQRIWYDEFLDRVFLENSPQREWRDDDETRITVDIEDRFKIRRLSRHVVADAVVYVARQRTRHVVRDWLTSLVWDEVPRIETAFEDYWGAASDEYTRAASKNFFLGMVARILRPGCKLDTMPVFEGPEGIKKSSALEILGGEWYSITHEAAGSKDFLQGLRGKWLLEIAELHSFGKADTRAIRNTLSTRNDDYRGTYGRHVRRYPRECVFAGTSNPKDWGNDENGLRRFWPIECGEINLELLSAAREQLFAEAVACFQAGESWWEMPAITADIQADRQQYDEWTAPLMIWCALQNTDDGITIGEALTQALKVPIERHDKALQMRVAKILKLAKWERGKVRLGNFTQWRWRKNSEIGGNVG